MPDEGIWYSSGSFKLADQVTINETFAPTRSQVAQKQREMGKDQKPEDNGQSASYMRREE
jgi:hypothetical protein